MMMTMTWMPTGMGKEEGQIPPPPEILKSFFVLQMLSKVSVDEVIMYYFEKMSSVGSALDPAGDFRPSDPLIAHPWKKFCGRP